MESIRLQKFLAQTGIGSRRACDELVSSGRVRVNGEIAEPGVRVDPDSDVVEVDGVPVGERPAVTVIALHKPGGIVTTMADDRGRPCVGDLVRDFPQRLFHVGRLDEATEGLLLLTNDGDFANLLMHPSHGVPKTYVATVRGRMTSEAVRQLLAGVELGDGPAVADRVMVRQAGTDRSVVELVIHEGRKHVVRRMLKGVGHPVLELLRTRIGSLEIGGLKAGEWRRLEGDEIARLRREATDKKP